jgi:hypothetical protein
VEVVSLEDVEEDLDDDEDEGAIKLDEEDLDDIPDFDEDELDEDLEEEPLLDEEED